MNITSMSGQDLYKTLFGRDVATKFKLSDEDRASITSTGADYLRDSLSLSTPYKVDPNTESVVSMFETGHEFYSHTLSLQPMTNNELAQHFADMGKRLDAAYAEGKFTEDEYNQLNDGLGEYITYMTEKNDRRYAESELKRSGLMPQIAEAQRNAQNNSSEQAALKSKQQLIEERSKAVDDFLQKHGSTDMNKLMEMVNKLRYSVSLPTNENTSKTNSKVTNFNTMHNIKF